MLKTFLLVILSSYSGLVSSESRELTCPVGTKIIGDSWTVIGKEAIDLAGEEKPDESLSDRKKSAKKFSICIYCGFDNIKDQHLKICDMKKMRPSNKSQEFFEKCHNCTNMTRIDSTSHIIEYIDKSDESSEENISGEDFKLNCSISGIRVDVEKPNLLEALRTIETITFNQNIEVSQSLNIFRLRCPPDFFVKGVKMRSDCYNDACIYCAGQSTIRQICAMNEPLYAGRNMKNLDNVCLFDDDDKMKRSYPKCLFTDFKCYFEAEVCGIEIDLRVKVPKYDCEKFIPCDESGNYLSKVSYFCKSKNNISKGILRSTTEDRATPR